MLIHERSDTADASVLQNVRALRIQFERHTTASLRCDFLHALRGGLHNRCGLLQWFAMRDRPGRARGQLRELITHQQLDEHV